MTTVNCSVTKSSWYLMYIEYSYTQNQSGCYSDVTHALKLKQLTDTYDFKGTMNVTYYVNGNAYAYSGTVDIDNKGNTGYTITIKSGSTRIYHDSTTGQAQITLSCSGSCYSSGHGPGTISLSQVSYDLTTIPRASVWTEMPYRWYINNDTGGIRNADPTGWNYTQVKYDKRAATTNRMWLKHNGNWEPFFATGDLPSPYYLYSNNQAVHNALDELQQNGVCWIQNRDLAATYSDTEILLRSYDESGQIMGDSVDTIRLEVTMPFVPINLKVTPNEDMDYSYYDNKFNVSWDPASFCSHYIIRYEIIGQNSDVVINTGEIIVEGHNTSSTIITIDKLLAGQKVNFYIKGRWSYVSQEVVFNFDSVIWSPAVTIQKQGGIVARVDSVYKNCHAYVTDNNGTPHKADAVYVYTYKDNSTEKEYRLVKMK